MSTHTLCARRFFCLALISLGALFSTAHAQQNQPQTPQQTDDVIRISTDLVQTDVTVFDKEGRFVNNLRREQFELLVDGKPQPITFFEQVKAGSASEETQLAVARGKGTPQGTEVVTPLDRGRTIFFFVDDVHMAFDSLIRLRKTLLHFIDREMRQNDQVAIVSANGQVGFLQQLTDNKTVLRAAVARLKSAAQTMRDMEQPPMSESMAQAIEIYRDADVLRYFVEPLLANKIPPRSAENMVKDRARQILNQSYGLTRVTLATLESLARSSAALPGRKLIFFISDGFMLNLEASDMKDRIRNITNISAKNGVVIYALDGRGLTVGGISESDNAFTRSNPRGALMAAMTRTANKDLSASQESLWVIATNTGGRAFVNSNSLDIGFAKAIQETSVYYLLAWHPETEVSGKDKFRQIEVKVINRPDLNVQVRRGYYDVATKKAVKSEKTEDTRAPAKTADHDLRQAIQSPYPINALPTQLSLIYMDTPDKGVLMTASIQIARQFMTFTGLEDKRTAVLDIAGVVLNNQGKPAASFKNRLDVAASSPQDVGTPRRDLIYNFQSHLPPGLYQMRVAARDDKSGRTGSAMQWIEIPDIASRHLFLSSLLLAETTKEAEKLKSEPTDVAESLFSVDHRFARSSKLRFLTYIYNAARGANNVVPPDVALQVQILRDDQPVMTTALRKVKHEGMSDLARLAYAAEIPLEEMLPGRYVLQITAIDRIAKISASQRANFEIE